MFAPEYILFDVISKVTSGQHEWLAKQKHHLRMVLVTLQRQLRYILKIGRAHV